MSRVSGTLLRLSLAGLALLWSSAALACPVCGGGGPNQQAFIDTMLFMSAAPLLMLGAIAGFVIWRVRNLPEDDPAFLQGVPVEPGELTTK